MEKPVEIREAVREDCPQIRALIQELAIFEEMPDGPKIDYQTLEEDGFLNKSPLFKCYVAVCDDLIVGYALYFYIYFTADKKVLHLEDLYVSPDYRKKSIGSRLFDTVAKKTFEEKCSYLDFAVLSWNPAQDFYKSKGSIDLTERDAWHMYRFPGDCFKIFTALHGSGHCTIRDANSSDLELIRSMESSNTGNVKNGGFKEISLKIEENDYFDEKNYKYLVVNVDKKIVGYALYCFAYSTWEGKSMFLQEFYVAPNIEHEKIVKLDLLATVIKKAVAENCCRIDFWLKDNKNESEFFISKGAIDLTKKEEWHLYRLFGLLKRPIA